MDADRIVASRAARNVTAFLGTLALCEVGTLEPIGYRALFGFHPTRNPSRVFTGWEHPRIRVPFTQTDGTTNYTTAAGRYQELWRTASRLRVKLNTREAEWFTPYWQDVHAMELISEQAAMAHVKAGNIERALELCAPIWASLPSARYKQPTRTLDFALTAFIDCGGALA